MNKAMERPQWLTPIMVSCMWFGLAGIEAGCSGISGFRSVGTERPSFLDFWDRPAGSPAPEDDTYVMSMRAGQARAAELAKRNDDPARGDADKRFKAGEQLAEAPAPEGGRQRKDADSVVGPDRTTIRVSLGRPEPLPGAALALASSGRQGTGVQWKADNQEPRDSVVADLAGPTIPRTPDETDSGRDNGPPPGSGKDAWKEILTRAESRLNALNTYQMKVSRAERVSGQLQPPEEIVLSIRRQPKAVRLEWASGPSKGREVIYSTSVDPRVIFVHMPSSAISLPVMKFSVDSPLVMKNSRHSIAEAGLDTILENLRKAEVGSAKAQSTAGTLSYHGIEKPAGVERPYHHFIRKTASGETWNVYLDQRSLLPALVVATDSRGAMIERYVYDDIHENPPELAAAGAFEPKERWGESKGLLGRLARAGSTLPTSSDATTR